MWFCLRREGPYLFTELSPPHYWGTRGFRGYPLFFVKLALGSDPFGFALLHRPIVRLHLQLPGGQGLALSRRAVLSSPSWVTHRRSRLILLADVQQFFTTLDIL